MKNKLMDAIRAARAEFDQMENPTVSETEFIADYLLANSDIIETGYLIYRPYGDEYCYSHDGLYKTERGAQRGLARWSHWHKNACVVKVHVVAEVTP